MCLINSGNIFTTFFENISFRFQTHFLAETSKVNSEMTFWTRKKVVETNKRSALESQTKLEQTEQVDLLQDFFAARSQYKDCVTDGDWPRITQDDPRRLKTWFCKIDLISTFPFFSPLGFVQLVRWVLFSINWKIFFAANRTCQKLLTAVTTAMILSANPLQDVFRCQIDNSTFLNGKRFALLFLWSRWKKVFIENRCQTFAKKSEI